MIDRPAGRRQGITSTDRGWAWQEESAVAFAGGDYEIRIKGRLSDRPSSRNARCCSTLSA
jgi:hypothetical protein